MEFRKENKGRKLGVYWIHFSNEIFSILFFAISNAKLLYKACQCLKTVWQSCKVQDVMSYVLLVNVLVSQLNKSVWTSKHIKLQQVRLQIKLLLKLLLLLLLLLLIVVQVFCFQRVATYEAPQISTLMIFIHAYQRTALHFLSDFIFYSFYVGGITNAKSNLW